MAVIVAENEKNDFKSDKYIHINSCGKHNNRNYTVVRRSGRRDYQLLYISAGSCTAVYDGAKYSLTPGDFILYPPCRTQRYSFGSDYGADTMWVHFSGSCINELLEDLNLSPGVFRCAPSDKIISAFNDLIHEHLVSAYMHETAENAFLIYLFTCISRHVSGFFAEKSVNIEEAAELMNENYREEYNPETYAALCSLSVSRFSHKFKAVTGVAPLQYFIGIKMRKACELLSFSGLTITEIAENVGYTNPLYFSRLFKKNIGLSPSKYRKQKTGL